MTTNITSKFLAGTGVIVTTSNNSNLKLRVGDLVRNAVLKSIHPNRVIFLYQDQLVEMGIGQ